MTSRPQQSRWQRESWEREPTHDVEGYCPWCADPGWQFWHCPRCGAELPESRWGLMDVCVLCELDMEAQVGRVFYG